MAQVSYKNKLIQNCQRPLILLVVITIGKQ